MVTKAAFAGLPETIQKIKPSIVGVGTYNRLASPNSQLLGTGFVVGNGQLIATNSHVVPTTLNHNQREKLVVFIGQGRSPEVRNATLLTRDETHDLALIKISGPPLKPLTLSQHSVREGELFSFTGFPIGAVLGLYPVTHQGIISSITPIATPVNSTRELSIKQLKALRNPYNVYQFDATAYPGNSGSPVYNQQTGEVIAVINKVFVKSTKETLLSDPSAITYAIPVKYLRQLIHRHN